MAQLIITLVCNLFVSSENLECGVPPLYRKDNSNFVAFLKSFCERLLKATLVFSWNFKSFQDPAK